ncbi:MAG: cytoplasmic protein [Desulfobacterales bacterium]|nr:cytoplasmic protein [Desulfobacterales bacterium]
MDGVNSPNDIDFTIDQNNLYREESITDLKVASIRKMVPIKPDGSEDTGRSPVFIGNSQLMTPEGPLPIQAKLSATTLAEAMKEFPQAMQKSLQETIEHFKQMQQNQQQDQQESDSRIITPR